MSSSRNKPVIQPQSVRALQGMLETHYVTLRELATRILAQRRLMQRAAGPDRVSPTSLVAEATLRLLLQKKAIKDPDQLHGLAALSMQRSLNDHARRRGAKRRSAPLEASKAPSTRAAEEPDDSVRVSLEALGRSKPRQVQVVTLVGLQGLTVAQAAKEMGVSVPTAERDLRAARLWLAQRLKGA
jgi:RNA polymerase sigma factor (TIGR02999 family)